MAAAPVVAAIVPESVVVDPVPDPSAGRLRRRKSRSPMSGGYQVDLLRVIDRARLPDDRDLDLSGVLELLLDVARDRPAEEDRRVVVDGIGGHDDADLAAG